VACQGCCAVDAKNARVSTQRALAGHAKGPGGDGVVGGRQVLDARDPLGTRCRYLEQHLRKHARHKHMLLLLNKCDLVRPRARGPGRYLP